MVTAFEESHTNSPDGTMVATGPEVVTLQEFFRSWMTEFVSVLGMCSKMVLVLIPKTQIREGWSARHQGTRLVVTH